MRKDSIDLIITALNLAKEALDKKTFNDHLDTAIRELGDLILRGHWSYRSRHHDACHARGHPTEDDVETHTA